MDQLASAGTPDAADATGEAVVSKHNPCKGGDVDGYYTVPPGCDVGSPVTSPSANSLLLTKYKYCVAEH